MLVLRISNITTTTKYIDNKGRNDDNTYDSKDSSISNTNSSCNIKSNNNTNSNDNKGSNDDNTYDSKDSSIGNTNRNSSNNVGNDPTVNCIIV